MSFVAAVSPTAPAVHREQAVTWLRQGVWWSFALSVLSAYITWALTDEYEDLLTLYGLSRPQGPGDVALFGLAVVGFELVFSGALAWVVSAFLFKPLAVLIILFNILQGLALLTSDVVWYEPVIGAALLLSCVPILKAILFRGLRGRG